MNTLTVKNSRGVPLAGKRRKRRPRHTESEVVFDHGGRNREAWLQSFVGWEMRLKEQNKSVGIIEEVVALETEEGEERGTHFAVVQGGSAQTKHLIPIVSDIVPSYRPLQRQVMLTPPEGLLELGRNQTRMEALRMQLKPYATAEHGQSYYWCRLEMPKMETLEQSGRSDLIQSIQALGGFAAVASVLGWKSSRKPWGYWDDLDTLDKEISYFIAASWIEAAGLRGSYYYNTVIHKIQWEAPFLLDALSVGDHRYSFEDPDQRWMPTKISIMNGRRWDLHHAIISHGGYRSVAAELERLPCGRASKPISYTAAALDVIHHFLQQHRLSTLPYLITLKQYNDASLMEAVEKVGSIQAAAKLLRVNCRHKPRPHARRRGPEKHKWHSIEDATQRLRSFMATQKDPTSFPTQSELIQADRYDLKYAIEKFGRAEIESALSLKRSQ